MKNRLLFCWYGNGELYGVGDIGAAVLRDVVVLQLCRPDDRRRDKITHLLLNGAPYVVLHVLKGETLLKKRGPQIPQQIKERGIFPNLPQCQEEPEGRLLRLR